MACDKLILTLKNKIHLYTYKENFSKKKKIFDVQKILYVISQKKKKILYVISYLAYDIYILH